MGVGGVLLYELVFDRPIILAIGGAILAFFVFLDVLRRVSAHWNDRLVQRIFGRISRPAEAHQIPSATWYMAGLVLGVWLLPQHAIELGTLVLALADPTASLVGKRWGRLKIRGDRSAAGTAAFFGAALLAGTVFLSLVRPDLLWPMRLAVAAAVAGAGALTELFSGRRLDDNFTLPLCCGAMAALLL
jgi:dolichol kinase